MRELLYLTVVLGGVQRGVEVESSVVDENIDLAVLGEDLVPQGHHGDDVGHLHLLELDQSTLSCIHLLPKDKQRNHLVLYSLKGFIFE